MNVQSLRTWALSALVLGATLCIFPSTSKAGEVINFTCDTCTTATPTGTISATGDLMVTWGSFGTFDLGNVASALGFTSPSFLTNGYTADWNAASTFVFFNLNNEGNTYGIEFVNGTNDGSLAVSEEGIYDNYGTYTVTNSTATPEPGTLTLLGSGLLGLAALSRSRLFGAS